MKILFIGGTGLISTACSDLTIKRGHDLTILNRAQTKKIPIPDGAQLLTADVHGDFDQLAATLAPHSFDVVVDWIAFTPEDVERDIRLFQGKVKQFIFISSASAYQKPVKNYRITEETPLENPYWQYSRDKIACETRLLDEYHRNGFPVTIIRPSLTYGLTQVPLCTGSWQHPYTMLDRIKHGKKVIIPGDGTSLWVCTWNADFAIGLVGLFGLPAAIGEAFHITSDEVLTWNQLYEQTAEAYGVKLNPVYIPSNWLAAWDGEYTGSLIGDKSNSVVFDNSKIKRFVPDFKCTVSWAEGVKRAIDWFEADPGRQTIDEAANQEWDQIITAFEESFPKKK
ncbi:SDR family oxidoreductase [Leptolinea tardivitalis]|uniref:NAD-dependent dehydratase n=1 Tax=Leptolinea tardivitalis TaxID=229920 RepID=A0A0P6X1N9_9CHLR|nr:SDR family oxidoreductase [Leptolinea tardivitalis]KPL73320.1 NAD-dependent dehydratase [Leptolinea tardivitalis]GAP21453.1 nucleoside-diphosphate-sugar epimerase [Leptolinea tardivitalis]